MCGISLGSNQLSRYLLRTFTRMNCLNLSSQPFYIYILDVLSISISCTYLLRGKLISILIQEYYILIDGACIDCNQCKLLESFVSFLNVPLCIL